MYDGSIGLWETDNVTTGHWVEVPRVRLVAWEVEEGGRGDGSDKTGGGEVRRAAYLSISTHVRVTDM